MRQNAGVSSQAGFSLLELLLVVLILSVIVGAIFSQMSTAQQRLSTEEIKIDDFQQARDFVDQFFRDMNQVGTPNVRMFDTTQTFTPGLATPQTSYTWTNPPNPYINDSRFAIGLVKIDNNEIQFEGSVNGTGTVQSVIYQINGSGGCKLCMMRSQVDKVTNTDPLKQGTNWGTEVNDIVSTTVFKFYQYDGTQIDPTTLPLDLSTQAGATALANVKTIQINLTIRNPNVTDNQTGLPIETSFEGEISLNNCSMAASSLPMSCF